MKKNARRVKDIEDTVRKLLPKHMRSHQLGERRSRLAERHRDAREVCRQVGCPGCSIDMLSGPTLDYLLTLADPTHGGPLPSNEVSPAVRDRPLILRSVLTMAKTNTSACAIAGFCPFSVLARDEGGDCGPYADQSFGFVSLGTVDYTTSSTWPLASGSLALNGLGPAVWAECPYTRSFVPKALQFRFVSMTLSITNVTSTLYQNGMIYICRTRAGELYNADVIDTMRSRTSTRSVSAVGLNKYTVTYTCRHDGWNERQNSTGLAGNTTTIVGTDFAIIFVGDNATYQTFNIECTSCWSITGTSSNATRTIIPDNAGANAVHAAAIAAPPGALAEAKSSSSWLHAIGDYAGTVVAAGSGVAQALGYSAEPLEMTMSLLSAAADALL